MLKGFMWKQIYRKSILHDNQFTLIEDLKPWEDQVFNIDMIQHCERIFVDDTVIYNYFSNSDSVTSRMIKGFNVVDFFTTIKLLFVERDKRAHYYVENRANANDFVGLLDLIVVTLCKNPSVSSTEAINALKGLLRCDSVVEKALKDSSNTDLNIRQLFVKFCLRYKLYYFLVLTVRHQLRKKYGVVLN